MSRCAHLVGCPEPPSLETFDSLPCSSLLRCICYHAVYLQPQLWSRFRSVGRAILLYNGADRLLCAVGNVVKIVIRCSNAGLTQHPRDIRHYQL